MVKRTTILMDEHLLKQIKRMSVDQNRTLKQITEEALWYYINRSRSQKDNADIKQNYFSSLKGSLKKIKFSKNDFDQVEKELFK